MVWVCALFGSPRNTVNRTAMIWSQTNCFELHHLPACRASRMGQGWWLRMGCATSGRIYLLSVSTPESAESPHDALFVLRRFEARTEGVASLMDGPTWW